MTTAAASDDRRCSTSSSGWPWRPGARSCASSMPAARWSGRRTASPVTEADRASEKIILAGLRAAFPDIPCVAEEEASAGIVPPDLDGAFFLIDPLDGTKEFVNRRTDFTVNIALVRHGVPEVGVVFAPCTGRFFSGRPGRAEALEIDRRLSRSPAAGRSRSRTARRRWPSSPAARTTRRRPTPISATLGPAEIVSVGSSLKFCLLASAEADVYPRFGRTMEWDTAAGDAVLRAAGGMTAHAGRQAADLWQAQPGGRRGFRQSAFHRQRQDRRSRR